MLTNIIENSISGVISGVAIGLIVMAMKTKKFLLWLLSLALVAFWVYSLVTQWIRLIDIPSGEYVSKADVICIVLLFVNLHILGFLIVVTVALLISRKAMRELLAMATANLGDKLNGRNKQRGIDDAGQEKLLEIFNSLDERGKIRMVAMVAANFGDKLKDGNK